MLWLTESRFVPQVCSVPHNATIYLQAALLKARASAPWELHLKASDCDGSLEYRACQWQRLVMQHDRNREQLARDGSALPSGRLLAADGPRAIGMFLVAPPVAQCGIRQEQDCHDNEDGNRAPAAVAQTEEKRHAAEDDLGHRDDDADGSEKAWDVADVAGSLHGGWNYSSVFLIG